MSTNIADWNKWFLEHRSSNLDDYFKFLRFKTIATDPQFFEECRQCALWLQEYLQNSGLEATLWETPGRPVVFAQHCKAGSDRPTLLIYHHYDVQPVDPLNLWESDPFEPQVRDGNVFARGAQDNKGQCFFSLIAIRAFLSFYKDLGFNLKILIEGEEEVGSCGTESILSSRKQECKSDFLLAVDTGLPGPNIPSITLGIRGILTMEVRCIVADVDMHSGSLGGVAYNPNRALAVALASLWDEEGRVAVPHFYDDVKELSCDERSSFNLEMSKEQVQKSTGLRCFSPEPGYSIGLSNTVRPTMEINGMTGGYTQEGFKTVIPKEASAKISCRLVPDQDPQKIFSAIESYLHAQMPEGMEMKMENLHGSAAFRSRKDSTIAKVCANAYEEVMGKPCQRGLAGGSIPIVTKLSQVSGADTVMMGFGLDTDQIHAPNEHFGLDRLEQGFLTMGRILCRLNESKT